MIDEVMYEIRELTGQTYVNTYAGAKPRPSRPSPLGCRRSRIRSPTTNPEPVRWSASSHSLPATDRRRDRLAANPAIGPRAALLSWATHVQHHGVPPRRIRTSAGRRCHGARSRRSHRLRPQEGGRCGRGGRTGDRPDRVIARWIHRGDHHGGDATRAVMCCATRRPTSWRRRSRDCSPARSSPSGRPSRTASTTTSSCPVGRRSATTTSNPSRPRCARS